MEAVLGPSDSPVSPAPALPPPDGSRRHAYGPAWDQFADLRLPSSSATPGPDHARVHRSPRGLPVAVVIHGGFWRDHRGLDMVEHLAADLSERGWATWNLEYGRVGGRGGWPTTLTDVAAGIDALADVAPDHDLDLDRVVTIGHSAGGHLALWAAARPALPDDAPGSGPRVVPVGVVSLAGVADLHAAARDDLGEGATPGFLGGSPDEVGDRYEVASPARWLPLGVPQVLVHGDDDEHVPVAHGRDHRSQALAAGDEVVLVEVPGGDHFVVIDVDDPAWERAMAALAATT